MAKDVITRFKLENNGFDSKIKQAAKNLSDLGKSATAAGKDFQEITKGSVEAARAFGSIQTSSNNAKERLKELTGAFNEVAKAYNSLTKEQQKSDWAKAMADSLTQLQQRIKDTKTELQGLGNEGGIFSKMGDKLGGAMSVFAGNLMTKATMEVANLGSEMAEMVKQGVEMAKAGEGIRVAFERLGNGQILNGLREATHGTVTDIELMKAAVKFNDFKLPIEELGTMLAFAQQKAKDTGQSVDYMVDSIVTGLGRKSLMILDNLGLSATEIKDKMAETGDMTKAVGAIIREQMQKAGDYVETAADRAAQANVDLQNKLEELGRKFLPVQEASNQLWTSMKIGILDIIGGPLARLLNDLTEAGRLRNALDKANGGQNGERTKVNTQLDTLRNSKKSGSDFMTRRIYNNTVEGYNRDIIAIDTMLKESKGHDANSTLKAAGQKFGTEFGSLHELRRYQEALKTMRNDYVRGAKDIMTPVKVEPPKIEPSKTGGSGGGSTGGSTSGKETVKDVYVPAEGSIDAQVEKVKELTKQWSAATDQAGRDGYKKQLDEAQGVLDQMRGKAKAVTQEMATGISGLTPDMIKWGENDIKQQMQSVEYGTQEYNDLAQRLIDYNSVSNLMQEAVKTGLEVDDSVKEYFVDALTGPLGEKIPQELYDSLVESLNEFKEYAGDNPIELDTETGNVNERKPQKKGDDDTLKETQKVVSGLSQVASGLQAMGIMLPSEVTKVLSMLQGAMTIVQGVSTIVSVFGSTSMAANSAAVGSNTVSNYALMGSIVALKAAIDVNTASSWIPFAEGGVIPKFAEGGVIQKFANGGLIGKAAGGMLIPGNSYSGDRLRMPVDGGRGVIGVNSGELILNMSSQDNLAGMFKSAESLVGTIRDESMALGLSQVGVLADALDNEGGAISSTPYVTGEQIYLGLNNYLKGAGLGQLVTSQ